MNDLHHIFVAPLAGARIEILVRASILLQIIVAPLAGARIEIFVNRVTSYPVFCRSPRGSED